MRLRTQRLGRISLGVGLLTIVGCGSPLYALNRLAAAGSIALIKP
jgi:hypothetical protein